MRYKLPSGIEICTENAAKPESQPSRYLLSLIAALPRCSSTFDYGCGKLRYQQAISATTDSLALVDSEIQLSRQQKLRGSQTSIREIFKQSNGVQAHNDVEFRALDRQFERGFCVNVLSVIPSYEKRDEVLSTIIGKLKSGGDCLFVVQYRNSEFTRMSKMETATPWLDGFLLKSLRGHSFYGMIPPPQLEECLKRARFSIRSSKLNEGSVYTWATAP